MKATRSSRCLAFDASFAIKPDLAAWFYRMGYRMAVRYVARYDRVDPVPREQWPVYLSRLELSQLLDAGLDVSIVQAAKFHGADLLCYDHGREIGRAAANNALGLKIPSGVTLWCDAEWTDQPTRNQIREYLRGWADVVSESGYAPGLYVGAGCAPPLSSADLYALPKYRSYWQSLSRVENVDKRGYVMSQSWEYVLRGSNPSDWRLEPMNDSNKTKGMRFDVNLGRLDCKGDRFVVVGK